MVAYSFQPRFLGPIRSREKQQTIRLERKRHARAGEQLQLFTGPRMKPVRVGRAVCHSAPGIVLDFKHHVVELDDNFIIAGDDKLNAFAIKDGFRPPAHVHLAPWEYMAKWWAITHPAQPVFQGRLIEWADSFEESK